MDNLNAASHSQTEAEAHDLGIGYARSQGDGPDGLHLISGSNGCS